MQRKAAQSSARGRRSRRRKVGDRIRTIAAALMINRFGADGDHVSTEPLIVARGDDSFILWPALCCSSRSVPSSSSCSSSYFSATSSAIGRNVSTRKQQPISRQRLRSIHTSFADYLSILPSGVLLVGPSVRRLPLSSPLPPLTYRASASPSQLSECRSEV